MYSANTASASSSYDSEVSLEAYSSSIDSDSNDSSDMASDTEGVDDKLEIFIFYKALSEKLSDTFSVGSLSALISVHHLKSSYGKVKNGVLPTEIDYTKKSHCIGYLQRYAACHAALVFDAVSDIFNSSDVLFSALNKKSLNIMFLGGGPGNDFVGFLFALHGHHHQLFDLDVTVVDKMSGWKDVFNETVESLRQGDCGKAGSIFDEVNILTTFISADLKDSEEWDDNMKVKLQNADIVFFVKSLSHIPNAVKLQVLQNVVDCLKLKSHLIYIDYPYPHEEFASLKNQLKIVYNSAKKRYFLGHQDSAFSFCNIDTCRAEVKVFERRKEIDVSFLRLLMREMNLL